MQTVLIASPALGWRASFTGETKGGGRNVQGEEVYLQSLRSSVYGSLWSVTKLSHVLVCRRAPGSSSVGLSTKVASGEKRPPFLFSHTMALEAENGNTEKEDTDDSPVEDTRFLSWRCIQEGASGHKVAKF